MSPRGPRPGTRIRNEHHTVKLGQGDAEQVIGLRLEQFSLLAAAAGRGCRLVKGGNEKALGVLARMGLVRFDFRNDGDWTVAFAVLTPNGAQALTQEPRMHAMQ